MADRINPATGSYDFLTWLDKMANGHYVSTERLAALVILHPEGSDIGDAAFASLAFKLGGLNAAHAAVAAERDAQEAEIFGMKMEAAWDELRASL